MQTSLHASNTFISYGDFFQSPFRILGNMIDADSFSDFLGNPALYYRDNISLDLDYFTDGFRMNLGLDATPLSINFNSRNGWGFGLDIAHVSVTGNVSLPEPVLGLQETSGEAFGVGSAVFVDFGVPAFFNVRNLRVNLRPAAYVPLLYIRPGITYSFVPVTNSDGNDGHRIALDYDIRFFAPVSLRGIFGDGEFDAFDAGAGAAVDLARRNMGYDISLGAEYRLSDLFSVGVSLVNIPLWAASLDHYARLQGTAFADTSYVDIPNLIGGGSLPDETFNVPDFEIVFGDGAEQRVFRPFAALFHLDYRPFGRPILTLTPSLGFSINTLFPRLAAVEGGLSARLSLADIFVVTLGTSHSDRRWVHGLDLALDLRLLEIGIGVSAQSPSLARSFEGTGIGFNFGVKVGF